MYTADEVDVLVVYLVPEDAWYLTPIRALGRRYCLYFHAQREAEGNAPVRTVSGSVMAAESEE
jgi:hypothetical protein